VDKLISLAGSAPMPQVRAIATQELKGMMRELERPATPAAGRASATRSATAGYLADEIRRFLGRPVPPSPRPELPDAPPGAPIGQPAMDWLRNVYGECTGGIR
jgi:hypothetical protein